MKTIYDFFKIEYGQREYHSKRKLESKDKGVPLISSKGTTQGIYGYFDITPKYKNVISVPSTGTICYAFYQGEDCCIDDNCLVLIPKKELSREQMFYFVMLIRKERYKYKYGRQVTPDKLGQTEIPKDFPAWVAKKRNIDLSNIKDCLNKKHISLKDRKWDNFEYQKIFTVKKGKRVLIKNIQDSSGKYNFISAIDSNNGVFCKTNIEPNQSANVITVNYDGNGVAEAYYQAEPFWALDSVNVLYPQFKLNVFSAIFIVTIVRKEKYRFNYGRKWHKERMEKSIIKLPVNDEGSPDWKFMEDYIKSLKYSKELNNISC